MSVLTPQPGPVSQGTFWHGADGNVWVAGSQGTHSAGPWDSNTALYWTGKGYAPQADPLASQQSNTTNNTDPGTSYGSGNGASAAAAAPTAPLYPDKSNDIAMQNAGLGQVDNTQNAGIKSIEDAWSKIAGQYDGDLSTAGNEYNNETTENTKDLETNKQTAMERAVSGRQGLFGTLASLGALNGDGIDLANRAVQKGANDDLTTASNSYATNQNGLDSGYNAYKQQEQRLRDQAESAKNNNEEQVKNDAVKNRQSYLTNIANDYQDEGKTDQAKSYTDQAASLFPQIASTNVPTINMAYSGGAYTAPTLSSYVGKANNTSVQTTPAASNSSPSLFNIPGLVALNKKTA